MRRLVILIVPYACMALAFAPFPGLAERVAAYRSTGNWPLWSVLNVGDIVAYIGAVRLMGLALLVTGLLARRHTPLELFAIYCCSLVAFSAAMANHYTVIPIAALAIGWDRFALGYFVVASLFELASPEGLGLGWLSWLHTAGDTSGALPWYRLMSILLLLHLATRSPHEA